MTRAPNWTEAEFETLLTSPHLSSDALAAILVRRSTGAIDVVRSGIHSYHTGGNISMLSQMMIKKLDQTRSAVICPICKEKL
jgi:hypothetical protein